MLVTITSYYKIVTIKMKLFAKELKWSVEVL